MVDTDIELKEFPSCRRLDPGFGVDPGGMDGYWSERIDVSSDSELVGRHDSRLVFGARLLGPCTA